MPARTFVPTGVVPDVGTIEILDRLDVSARLPGDLPLDLGNCLGISTGSVGANTTKAHDEGGHNWISPGSPVTLRTRC